MYGAAAVAGASTFSGAIPAVAPATKNRATLIAVVAYKVVGAFSTTAPTTVDFASAVDLTDQVSGRNTAGVAGGTTTGTLRWTAPAGATWALVALYGVGTIAQPDLLTDAGRRVLTDNMDEQFAPIKDLLRANRGDLFYDSHTGDRGSPTDTWSNTLAADFKRLKRYSLIPYLPLLVTLPAVGFGAAAAAFEFSDAARAIRFRNDFAQARTDLWINTQIVPLQHWARRYNQQIRLQPYGDNGFAVDSIQAAAVLDRVETETLWFGDEVDNYLPEASAVHLLGKKWYSIEGSAVLNEAYAMTWQDQVIHMNKAFAGGVTKLVYHIYPYRDSTTSVWPGFSLFPDSFGNSWGPRSPHWKDAPAYNAYLARNQQVLTQGSAQRDVAVYLQNYVWPQPYTAGNLQYWSDPALDRNGYTRDYLNPTLIAHPKAKVRNGRLAADGPAYRALILDSTQQPASAPSRNTIPVDTARRIVGFARSGLPVVVVGSVPSGVPGIDAAGDAEVKQLMKDLLRLPSTHVVATEADVPALLLRLGIEPAARPAAPSPVLSVHRRDSDTDYYWLYNQGSVISAGAPGNSYDPIPAGATVDTTFTLSGSGVPILLHTWDGSITPITEYRVGRGTITVRVQLATEDTTIVALTRNPARFGLPRTGTHVVSTTADAIVADGHTLLVQAEKAGRYSTVLSDGRRITTNVGAVPAALDLTSKGWSLAVQDWRPAASFGTTGVAGTQTEKVPVKVTLAGLKPWPEISALENTSGIGTYRLSFVLGASWSGTTGAVLDLGSVTDSFTVKVNGHEVPFMDQLTARAEIGRYLRTGVNTLEVTVATTLINRLRTLDKVQSSWPQQANGLVGPVVVTPTVRVPLHDAH